MFLYFWIAAGSALGGVGRFWISGLIARNFGEAFPVGTLIVNITGCFLIGFIATAGGPGGRWMVGGTTRQFLMTGILGGYTTFSSFSLQTLNLARDGQWFSAGAYAVLSLILCLLGVWLGHLLAASLNQLKGA